MAGKRFLNNIILVTQNTFNGNMKKNNCKQNAHQSGYNLGSRLENTSSLVSSSLHPKLVIILALPWLPKGSHSRLSSDIDSDWTVLSGENDINLHETRLD